MRASRWATIPTANATDIVPIRFSAASAAVHLARPTIPGHARPRAPLGLARQVMATTTLVAPSTHIRSPETRTPYTTCASQSPLSLLL